MQEQRSRTYPIHENMQFQKRWWLAERISWVVIIGLPIIALSGLFSNGLLSGRTIGDASHLTLTYDRFQRVTRQVQFQAAVTPSGVDDVTLRLGPGFSERYEVTDIAPTPLRSASVENTISLTFAQPSSGALTVVIWAHPRKVGAHSDELTVGDRSLSFWTMVYP